MNVTPWHWPQRREPLTEYEKERILFAEMQRALRSARRRHRKASGGPFHRMLLRLRAAAAYPSRN